MAAENIQPLIDKVTQAKGTMKSALLFIQGEATRLRAAIDQALANGATAVELQPLTDEVTLMDAEEDNLAIAVAANP